MIIYFEKDDVKREIGRSASRQEANKLIKSFLKERNYEDPYWRYSYYSDHLWIDVGSWSEFFTIYPENEEEKKELTFG